MSPSPEILRLRFWGATDMRYPATRLVVAFSVAFISAVPGANAQSAPDWRAEVFASTGGTGLSRFEDEGFGRHRW